MDLYTIGHSTHSKEEFIYILHAHQISLLVDIRTFPGSRHLPHFNQASMSHWLREAGIEYLHMPNLGGRRKTQDIDESLVAGWRNPSFRNYAAYALSNLYMQALYALMELAMKHRVCMMCAESVPWRCHRSIISNNLTLKGWEVYHIMSASKATIHFIGKYGAMPVEKGDVLIYPAEDSKVE